MSPVSRRVSQVETHPMQHSQSFRSAWRCFATITCIAVELVIASTVASAQAAQAPTAPVLHPATLRIALVMADMTVRPIPLQSLEVLRLDSAGSTVIGRPDTLRTGLDGSVQTRLPAGRHRVRSLNQVTLQDTTYHWDVVVEVGPAMPSVDLTNANAVTRAAAATSTSPYSATGARGRQVAPEREAFERVRAGVFRIEAGLGHGTGFLIAVPGLSEPLVVTNDHVVYGQTTASVYLDTITRVSAQVVARNAEADLALLRIPLGRCQTCPRLAIATPGSDEPLVVAGERLLAIGFPLSQELTLTTGVASSVRDGAIISDVNINPGNSGGPLLTTDGTVVAVNTFGEVGRAGPGVSGSVVISKVVALFPEAARQIAALPPVPDDALPTMPRSTYPVAALKALADTVDPKSYRKVLERSAGNFLVNTSTPVHYRVAQRLSEADVAKDRRKREKAQNVSAAEQYSEVNQTRDWEQYVGDALAPVVSVAITPKLAETFWSAFGRGLQAAGGAYVTSPATMKFAGDVRGVRFYRNGQEVEPIRGGHGPQAVRINNAWMTLKDVADMGYYVLPIEAFRPDSVTGAPARLTVVIQDLKNPSALSITDIDNEASARIWNDFAPYWPTRTPVTPWRPANAKLKSPKVPLECDAKSGACSVWMLPTR